MIGDRLKLARAASGLSLRDLAERIDHQVSAQAIGKYERNEMTPGSSVLLVLARALGVSESYLVSSGDLEFVDVDFRKKGAGSTRQDAILAAKVMGEVERYVAIEDILGMDGGAWNRPSAAPFPVRSLADAEVAAATLRGAWNLGGDPIPDLAEFLEEKGIKIIAGDLPLDVSGMLCWVKRRNGADIPVIVLNRNHSGERQRFTLAHELGHLILDVAGVDEERVCQRFAGAFLMPAESLWREIGKHRRAISMGELFSLKAMLGVSVQAITFRCKDLGIIGEPGFRSLFRAFSMHGWRSPPFPEPQALRPEQPQRFRRLCMRALAEQVISESRGAELLGISVRQLTNEMDQPPV